MEDTLRDLNKLIAYYRKLTNQEDTQESSGTEKAGSISPSSSLNLSSSSLSSIPFSNTKFGSFESSYKSKFPVSKRPSFISSSIISTGARPTPPNSLSLIEKASNLSLTETPSNLLNSFNITPCDEAGGSFIIKKNLDDDTINRRKKYKLKASKSSKVSHSIDIINLLTKLGIPIQLSSQYEDCLKELLSRKEVVDSELNLYITQLKMQSGEKKDDSSLNKTNSSFITEASKNSALISDANSDISSCLDSNYESDYSVKSFNFSVSNDSKSLNSKFSIPDENKEAPENNLKASIAYDRQITITNSNAVANSDDSDVTINEVAIGDGKKEAKLLNDNQENGCLDINNLVSNQIGDGLDNPSTATPNNTPTDKYCFKLSDNQAKTDLIGLNDQLNPKLLSRQFSDGYSSSCTPLSASSINNEQPTKNPFFTACNSANNDENHS